MAKKRHMKKHNIAIFIAIILFFIPFLWLKPGFVDVGGDSGRLYFVDPLASALHKYNNQTTVGASVYAFIPYELFLGMLHTIVTSPTYLIGIDRGIVLSVAFYSIYLIVIELSLLFLKTKKEQIEMAAIAS